MEDLLIIDSLRELQAKESNLSDKLNIKLTELYKWYNDQLNLISDDMLCILNNPKLKHKPNTDTNNISIIDKNNKQNKDKQDNNKYNSENYNEIELSFVNLSVADKIIDFGTPTHGTKSWPGFWLHALLGCNTTKFWISDEDFDILYHLNDIRVQVFESNENSESFEISFLFTENPFFTNSRIWRRFDFNKNVAKSECGIIDWIVKDNSDYKSGFFRFFESEIEYDDLKMAMCIKDRIRRNPLKYVLRYQSQLNDEKHESDSDDDYPKSNQIGTRYPFSWLFGKY